jgi:asparagine synthase (glutamine-hydrolysing)
VASAAAGVAGALGRLDPVWRRRAEVARDVLAGREMFVGGAVAFPDEAKDEIWAGPREASNDAPPWVAPAHATFDSEGVVRHEAEAFRRAYPAAGFYAWMLNLELRMRLPELLLMRVDKMCMAESVEARVPFLDHHVVEFTMPLPFRMRVRGATTKFLLRHAVRDLLPRETIDRPKMGFAAPFREWFRGPFGEDARARLAASRLDLLDLGAADRLMAEHRSGSRDHSFKLWVLLNLVVWHEHWIE